VPGLDRKMDNGAAAAGAGSGGVTLAQQMERFPMLKGAPRGRVVVSHSLLAFLAIANMLSASRFFIGLKHGGEFRWQEAVEGGGGSH